MGYAADAPRALVVYYSRDGHTQKVAEALAARLGADIQRLADRKKRTGPVGSLAAGKDALAGRLTVLGPVQKNAADYDIVLIGTPSWFSNPSPAVRTYVSQVSLKNKIVGVFGTAHLSGVEDCLERLAGLIDRRDPSRIPRLALRHRDLEPAGLAVKIDQFCAQLTSSGVSR
jgi:flavodoxin